MTVSWNSPFSSYIVGRANTNTCIPSVGAGSMKFCLANITQRSCADLSRREKYQRSEEHTSELQSQSNLVCRLLLEKKKLPHTAARKHSLKSMPTDADKSTLPHRASSRLSLCPRRCRQRRRPPSPSDDTSQPD